MDDAMNFNLPKTARRGWWLSALPLALCMAGLSAADNPMVHGAPDPASIPREELVMVAQKPGASVAAGEVLAALGRAEHVPSLDIPELGVQVYWTPGRAAVLPPAVEQVDGVAWASKVATWNIPTDELVTRRIYEPTTAQAVGPVEREPFWVLQWNMRAIGDRLGHDVRDAWPAATGLGSVVGIIDTGVDCSHVDIPCVTDMNHLDATRRVEMAGATDVLGHGTHVAGIVAARHNGRGVVGVAKDAEVVSIKACSNGGTCAELDVMYGIVWAAQHGIKVSNASLGGAASPYTNGLCESIDWAARVHQMLMVAAVGNHGTRLRLYPAGCSRVLGTAASIRPDGDTIATYSERDSVKITAPGGSGGENGIVSALPGGGWGYMTGTSMAAPHTAGAAALILEHLGNRWTVDLASRLLLENTRKICGAEPRPDLCGHGALNVYSAVRAVMPPPPAEDEPTATPWWETPEQPTTEPTPTVEPTATNIPPVETALAELTASAQPPTEEPTATETASPTRIQGSSPTATTPPPPTASRTATVSPTPSDTPDAVALTVTALWPTRTPNVPGTLTAIAPTPDRVGTAVWATLNAPGAAQTRAAEATARAKGRMGPLFFPALLRVEDEPTPGPTDSCRDVLYPWACPQRTRDAMATREVEGTATAVAAATQTAAAPTPTPGRTWPEDDPRSGYRTITIYQRWAPGQVATMQAEDRAMRLGLPLLRKEIR